MNPFQTHFVGRRSLAVAVLLFGSGVMAITAANPATWLYKGFDTAINGNAGAQNVANQRRTWTPLVAASEDYWLGTPSPTANNSMMQQATWQVPVTKGDRFTISAKTHQTGRTSHTTAREFEVITVEPLLTSVRHTKSSEHAKDADQFLVICRSTDKNRPEMLKFVIDSTSGLPWAAAPSRTAHAL